MKEQIEEAINEDIKTTNGRNENKRLKHQDKNRIFEHHNEVQTTKKTDLINQVSRRQEQILW